MSPVEAAPAPKALAVLKTILVKGRAPKTGYERSQFGDGWGDIGTCDTRNFILIRDLRNETFRTSPACTVATGTLVDPYTLKTIYFVRGVSTSLAARLDCTR